MPKEEALIPNPIHKVLSTFQNCGVRALLMGGQACVFYGAAEFSRDIDFAIHLDAENLGCLEKALRQLEAQVIAVPPLNVELLLRGHAVHFRCQHPEASRLRIDVMAKMRGVDPFELLWERRTTLQTQEGTIYDLLSLPDLVRAKKTQRDKDWPMIRRLLEADRAATPGPPTPDQVRFWLAEARTPALLIELAHDFPNQTGEILHHRPLLAHAIAQDSGAIERALESEESEERAKDRIYWEPLRRELEQWRRKAQH